MAIKYLGAGRIQGSSTGDSSLEQDYLSQTGNATSQLDESATKYGIKLASNNPLIGNGLLTFTMELRKRNSPTGNIYAKIYKGDSTTATATSTNYFDASALPPEGNTVFEDRTWTFAAGVILESGDRIVYEGGSHNGTDQITFHRVSGGFTDTVSIAHYTSSWASDGTGDPLYKVTTTQDDKATLVRATTGDGTITGATSDTGKVGNALRFSGDGSQYVSVSGIYPNANVSSTTWSFNMWVKLDIDSEHQALLTSGSSSSDRIRFTYDKNNDDFGVTEHGIASGAYGGVTLTDSITRTSGVWYMVTFVRDGLDWEHYVNGSSRSTYTQNVAGIPPAAHTDWEIGKIDGSSGESMDGLIDETTFWSVALSSDDVDALYSSTSGIAFTDSTFPEKTNVIAHYDFNDTGTTLQNKKYTTDIPENTIFEEIDTKQYHWLKSGNWVASPLQKPNTQSNWTLTSGNTIETDGTAPQEIYFDHDTDGLNHLTLPFNVDTSKGTFDFDRYVESGGQHTNLQLANHVAGYGTPANGNAHIDIFVNEGMDDTATLRCNAASSDAASDVNFAPVMSDAVADTWYYMRLTWEVNSDGTSTWKLHRYTDYARTTLTTIGDDTSTATMNSANTDQWEAATINKIVLWHHTSNSVKPSKYANFCITNGIVLPQVAE